VGAALKSCSAVAFDPSEENVRALARMLGNVQLGVDEFPLGTFLFVKQIRLSRARFSAKDCRTR
jgi:hypothetical protein